MSGRAAHAGSRRTLAATVAILSAASMLACGPTYYEIPIETPIRPKLDVSAFQRVLIAGFVAGGSEEVDGNQETVRLLRSQLRTRSSLRIVDADPLPLIRIAQSQNRAEALGAAPPSSGGPSAAADTAQATQAPQGLPAPIKTEQDIEQYERLFANTAYWKQVGEEYQNPLIVTGSVLFTERTASDMVTRQRERVDAFGRREVENERGLLERRGYILRPKFIFIDGRTGRVLYAELHREEILYSLEQNMPPLSSYFELMDRLVPNFLNALSSQKVKGLRVLMK